VLIGRAGKSFRFMIAVGDEHAAHDPYNRFCDCRSKLPTMFGMQVPGFPKASNGLCSLFIRPESDDIHAPFCGQFRAGAAAL
jgi:hypothetical protein